MLYVAFSTMILKSTGSAGNRYTMRVNYYLICPIGIIAGPQDELTYTSNTELEVGAVVKIPFGRHTKIGVVTATAPKPSFKTRPIEEDTGVIIPSHLIELARWISSYYATRLSFVLQTILPSGITKKRRALKPKRDKKITRDNTEQPLTVDQKKTVTDIRKSDKITHLIHGITGSGKTRVYKELAIDALNEQQSVVVLVPEIALTPQLASEFQQLHSNVLIMHSNLTESQRHQNWQLLLDSQQMRISLISSHISSN